MPKSRSIDIDDKFDFDVVKKLMKKNKYEKYKQFFKFEKNWRLL